MKLGELESSEIVRRDNVGRVLELALDAGDGLLRLKPNWVPRTFVNPGRRLKLHPDDWYAYGAHRGGIDERWLASTIDASNPGRVWHEGQSICTFENQLFMLRDAIAEAGSRLIGPAMFDKYGRWPVISKFFDNMGPIPHHIHQRFDDAKLTGQEGKPEAYYFPPQMNNVDNNFPYTFMGLEPGTTKEDVRRCLDRWNNGDNGILDLSRAYRLKCGTGWLIPPGVLHAPGSLCTYEPQWASDVFAMFQSQVEGREVPWDLLVKDVPEDHRNNLDFIIGMLDWERNVESHFKTQHFIEPVVDQAASGNGYTDRWIVYGTIDNAQLFSAKELTVEPGARCTLREPGASGWITVQGSGRMNRLSIQAPAMIRFNAATTDEIFISHESANRGVDIANVGAEPLVGLRYFGPEVHKTLPSLPGQ